jgi:hypothetical protein
MPSTSRRSGGTGQWRWLSSLRTGHRVRRPTHRPRTACKLQLLAREPMAPVPNSSVATPWPQPSLYVCGDEYIDAVCKELLGCIAVSPIARARARRASCQIAKPFRCFSMPARVSREKGKLLFSRAQTSSKCSTVSRAVAKTRWLGTLALSAMTANSS